MASQPTTPSGWKVYGSSFPYIPDQSSSVHMLPNYPHDWWHKYVNRGIYVDRGDLEDLPGGQDGETRVIFADVVDLTNLFHDLPMYGPFGRLVQGIICARVLTSTDHVVWPIEGFKGRSIVVCAEEFDCPITLQWAAGEEGTLTLDNDNFGSHSQGGKIGVRIEWSNESPNGSITYLANYDEFRQLPELQNDIYQSQFRASLTTQLRVAQVQLWQNPSMAADLAAFLVKATNDSPQDRNMNTLAMSIRQYAVAQAITGNGVSYAPLLKISPYVEVLNDGLEAASGFETQYHRFQDRARSLQDKVDIWTVMADQAQSAVDLQSGLTVDARKKYDEADRTVDLSMSKFKAQKTVVEALMSQFETQVEDKQASIQNEIDHDEDNLKELESEKARLEASKASCKSSRAAWEILLGMVGAAHEHFEEAKIDAQEAELSKETKLTVDAIMKLRDLLQTMITVEKEIDDIAKLLEEDPTASIPSQKGHGSYSDLNGIISIAAWDVWSLETDEEMQFAIRMSVDGASAFRDALREYAIYGKLVVQSKAQAINAGQEYVHAQLRLNCRRDDLQQIQSLLDKFKNEELAAEVAEAMFYDQLMSLKIALTDQMLNLRWAYKYYTLQDDAFVKLDPTKSVAAMQLDLFNLHRELIRVDETYTTDFSEFTFHVPDDHPMNGLRAIVDSLKQTHQATFTLASFIPANSNSDISFAEPFINGTHFRVSLLEVTLNGARPIINSAEHQNYVLVRMDISTSGMYLDIGPGQDNNDTLFAFTGPPRSQSFQFSMDRLGGVHISVHPSFSSQDSDHAEPTAFTQWTISIENPEVLDLSGLSSVTLKWKGRARFM